MPLPFPFLADAQPWLQSLVGLVLLFLLALLLPYLAQLIFLPVLQGMRRRTLSALTDVVLHDKVLHRLARILPSLVVQAGIHAVPHLQGSVLTVVGNVAMALTVLQVVRTLMAMLDAVLERQAQPDGQGQAGGTGSIKSYVQLAKLLLGVAAAIVAVAVLLDRSPLILLSGLGAMSAVLMLVFKDTILSLHRGRAAVQSNDMLRVGDWIEMPQVGADGDVIDIALHTVKVQNWDKTITTIPTWRLMSESYQELARHERVRRAAHQAHAAAGCQHRALPRRRRSASSLRRIGCSHAYLDEKQARNSRPTRTTRRLGDTAELPANQRRLTNLGTFRAYVDAYLRATRGSTRT